VYKVVVVNLHDHCDRALTSNPNVYMQHRHGDLHWRHVLTL